MIPDVRIKSATLTDDLYSIAAPPVLSDLKGDLILFRRNSATTQLADYLMINRKYWPAPRLSPGDFWVPAVLPAHLLPIAKHTQFNHFNLLIMKQLWIAGILFLALGSCNDDGGVKMALRW